MNTAVALADDMAELQDVMFAIEATREQELALQSAAVPLVNAELRAHLSADSRARAWIPAHLLSSLR